MSKEYLEALGFIKALLKDDWVESVWETHYDVIKQALTKLESIENANHSEVMNCLKELTWQLYGDTLDIDKSRFSLPIKNALLKAQEQEKVLEIIKEKEIDIHLLKACITCYVDSLNAYNSEIKKLHSNHKDYQNKPLSFYLLTQEEFELLKRYFNE